MESDSLSVETNSRLTYFTVRGNGGHIDICKLNEWLEINIQERVSYGTNYTKAWTWNDADSELARNV